jgi:hypothetical protein
MVHLRTFVFSLLCASACAQSTPYDYANQFTPTGGSQDNESINYVAPTPHKYDYWYGEYEAQLELISTGVCNLSLAAYRGDQNARATLGPVRSYCWTHSNCILSSVTPAITQSITGASILLGLTPTILSVLGPSVAEIALLSMHRPILSALLSLGAPAIFPGRFLVWEDPLRANEPQTGAFIVSRLSPAIAIAVSIAQYVIVLGAVAVTIYTALTMGIRAVLVWYCDVSYWPLLWVVLSLVIHIIAILSLRLAIRRKKSTTDHPSKSRIRGPWSMIKSEFTLSANSEYQVRDHFNVRLGPLAVGLQYIGALTALVHLVFGTAMFSSLLYIGNGDAIPLIMRFITSAVVCRVILQFEIGGMIRVGEERAVYRGIVQPLIYDLATPESVTFNEVRKR